MKGTVETFLECSGGVPRGSVPAQQFMETLLGHEVDDSFMRKLFNAFHETCPNFIVGENDCPDCRAEHERETR